MYEFDGTKFRRTNDIPVNCEPGFEFDEAVWHELTGEIVKPEVGTGMMLWLNDGGYLATTAVTEVIE